jgi:hypothetical protein
MEKYFTAQKFYFAGLGIPLLLIVIGAYYLLKSMGYISNDVAFWPIILIAIGVYWLLQRITYNFFARK